MSDECRQAANEHWALIRAEFADGRRSFTEIKPQPLAHERIRILEAEVTRLKAALNKRTEHERTRMHNAT